MGTFINFFIVLVQEQLEDTKGVIRNRKSKKDRQYNKQKDKQQSTRELGFMMLYAPSTIFELYRDSQNFNFHSITMQPQSRRPPIYKTLNRKLKIEERGSHWKPVF